MNQISICIPFYLRGEKSLCLEKTFDYYSKLPFLVHLCGSEGDFSQNFAKPFLNKTTKYVEVPQEQFCTSSAGDEFLRKKFNDSLATLPMSEWRLLIGANDIITTEFFDYLDNIKFFGIAMAGVDMNNPFYLVEPRTKRMFDVNISYKDKYRLQPGVNAFSNLAYEYFNGEMYAQKGCETGAELMVKEKGFILPLPGSCISLKGDNDLNSVKHILSRHRYNNPSREAREMLKRWT